MVFYIEMKISCEAVFSNTAKETTDNTCHPTLPNLIVDGVQIYLLGIPHLDNIRHDQIRFL
jgi:hypothetical protein